MEDTDRAVVVDGWGPVAAELAAQLRRVRALVRAGAHAADAAELEVASGAPPPSAVVLVSDTVPAPWARTPSLLAPWHAARVPVLPVVTTAAGVVVGPLVVPGVPPCLLCSTSAGPPPTAPVTRAPDPAATVLAAAVATVTVLGVLSGDPSLAGISTEVGPRGGTVGHRVWTSRPGCGCASVRMAG